MTIAMPQDIYVDRDMRETIGLTLSRMHSTLRSTVRLLSKSVQRATSNTHLSRAAILASEFQATSFPGGARHDRDFVLKHRAAAGTNRPPAPFCRRFRHSFPV